MFNKVPFDAEVDARFYMILETIPLELKMICFGFPQDMFLFVRAKST